jgi:hypothetical protein
MMRVIVGVTGSGPVVPSSSAAAVINYSDGNTADLRNARTNFPYKNTAAGPAGALVKGNKELVQLIGGKLEKSLKALSRSRRDEHMRRAAQLLP